MFQDSYNPYQDTDPRTNIDILMEQHKWEEADSYCANLLETQPEDSDLHLARCMAAYHITDENALRQCDQVLTEDRNFQLALHYASPERKEVLQDILHAQSDLFLRKCMKKFFFSDPKKFHLCFWVRLKKDPDFQNAMKCASEEQLKSLNKILTKQKIAMGIVDGSILVALLICLVYTGALRNLFNYLIDLIRHR